MGNPTVNYFSQMGNSLDPVSAPLLNTPGHGHCGQPHSQLYFRQMGNSLDPVSTPLLNTPGHGQPHIQLYFRQMGNSLDPVSCGNDSTQ